MTQQKRPEWIDKAAQAVTTFVHHEQEGLERMKENVQSSQAKLKADAQQTQEKIAGIIHQHFQGHK